MTPLSSQTPAEIDAKLAELRAAGAKAAAWHDHIQTSLIDAWRSSRRSHYTEADADKAWAELLAVIEAELHYEAEYERRPWQRYWHVMNANGHIHRSQACSSCLPTTQYAWRTDLSGLTDVEVVEREAHNACSVCMPIAPVEQRAARERFNAEQREAKRAERQAKADAKIAKAQARAVKLADKVEAEIEKMGGLDTFRNSYSLNGHDGRISVYDATFDMPQTVGDVLYEMKQRQEEGSSHHRMNEHIRAELIKRGLIDD